MTINEPRQTLCDTYGEPRHRKSKAFGPLADNADRVIAWQEAWKGFSAETKARWHALPKEEREASKRLTAEEFTELMTKRP